ncbi:hypothetical protein BpHYR1_023429 [Brachionus plicatilis]|uniref:C2H2-type domain-containing protein n=1 Tax=Brachionus plicatilis TaxID=10195 RepID=A0A3M7P5L0_BRAPC|nr:hypothetical protein BpHYR1_023429 [Brachionus plicatilis]
MAQTWQNKEYDLHETYESLDLAIDAVNNFSEKWTRGCTRKTQEGEKRFYTCRKQCPKRLYILLNNEDHKVSIHISNDQHENHDNKIIEACFEMIEG